MFLQERFEKRKEKKRFEKRREEKRIDRKNLYESPISIDLSYLSKFSLDFSFLGF